MSNKIKNITVTAVFALFLAFFAVMCVTKFYNPDEYSDSERRELAQFPADIIWELSEEQQKAPLNAYNQKLRDYITKFESYSVDQFPFREFFRSIKAHFVMNGLQMKENNGLAVENGYIGKIETSFNDQWVNSSVDKLENIYNTQIKDKADNVFLSIIPDKNYYLGEEYGYPTPDYAGVIQMMKDALPESTYIDIFGELSLEDFYRTDSHWDQSKILDVVNKLAEAMGFTVPGEYTENKLEGFKGVYHGQSALNPAPDTITYLTNDVINGMKLQNAVDNKFLEIYNLEKFEGEDGYNLFLSGAAGYGLLRIINPAADNNKTLVVFRDSFGSSIAPLIAQGYRTVYVVDIRSVNPELLSQKTDAAGNRNPYYIDFTGKDVLFLYSALVLNSNSFR